MPIGIVGLDLDNRNMALQGSSPNRELDIEKMISRQGVDTKSKKERRSENSIDEFTYPMRLQTRFDGPKQKTEPILKASSLRGQYLNSLIKKKTAKIEMRVGTSLPDKAEHHQEDLNNALTALNTLDPKKNRVQNIRGRESVTAQNPSLDGQIDLANKVAMQIPGIPGAVAKDPLEDAEVEDETLDPSMRSTLKGIAGRPAPKSRGLISASIANRSKTAGLFYLLI